MWRSCFRRNFSSRYTHHHHHHHVSSSSSCSVLRVVNDGVVLGSPPPLHRYSSSPSSFSASDSFVKLGFVSSSTANNNQSSSDGIPVLSSSSTSSLSATATGAAVDLSPLASIRHYARCYWELSKARLSMLVVATSGTGYVLGSGSAVDMAGLFYTCAGTMMVAAAANSLNQVFEINNDAKMKRTRQRPLPSNRITVPPVVTWASFVGLAGTSILASKTNMLAAGLAASNLVLYAFVYTPLKQIHPVNTWVGAVVGAIPPLLGWAAACGQVSLNAMILPAALYFWQIPHFMALAFMCRNDYAAGGFKMFSLADTSGRRTASVALRNCLYLVPLGFLAYDWGVTSGWFCLESSLLTLAISASAFSFYRDRTLQKAKWMFYASLLYLPVFMSGLLFHRILYDEQCVAEDRSELIGDVFLPLETEDGDSGNIKQKNKEGLLNVSTQARSPVSHASIAPFPFLPAPSYGAW